MKTFIALLSMFVAQISWAAPDKKAETANAVPAANGTSSNKTSHSFEDLLVQGQYHFSDEAVTTVEEDKVLDALIGVRTDFKDRLKKSTANR